MRHSPKRQARLLTECCRLGILLLGVLLLDVLLLGVLLLSVLLGVELLRVELLLPEGERGWLPAGLPEGRRAVRHGRHSAAAAGAG